MTDDMQSGGMLAENVSGYDGSLRKQSNVPHFEVLQDTYGSSSSRRAGCPRQTNAALWVEGEGTLSQSYRHASYPALGARSGLQSAWPTDGTSECIHDHAGTCIINGSWNNRISAGIFYCSKEQIPWPSHPKEVLGQDNTGKLFYFLHKFWFLTSIINPGGGGGVLRFGSDGCVPLKPPNLYPSLRVILAEKGTHY